MKYLMATWLLTASSFALAAQPPAPLNQNDLPLPVEEVRLIPFESLTETSSRGIGTFRGDAGVLDLEVRFGINDQGKIQASNLSVSASSGVECRGSWQLGFADGTADVVRQVGLLWVIGNSLSQSYSFNVPIDYSSDNLSAGPFWKFTISGQAPEGGGSCYVIGNAIVEQDNSGAAATLSSARSVAHYEIIRQGPGVEVEILD